MNNFVKNTLNNTDFKQFINTDSSDSSILSNDNDSFKYSKFSPFRKENKRNTTHSDTYNRNSYPKPPQSHRTTPPSTRTTPTNAFKFKERELRNRQKRSVCNNCGIQGHLTVNCKEPVHSYGLIILNSDKSKILLVQRKDSFGYITLINNEKLPSGAINMAVKEITEEEQQKIICFDFESLWRDVINNPRLLRNNSILEQNKQRFKMYQIKDIVKNIDPNTLRTDTEWGFPKGRIKKKEKWIECAKREASEETNLSEENIEIISDMPFMENIKGFDGKMYINIYYVARLKDDTSITVQPQKQEIKRLRWVEMNNMDDFFDTSSTSPRTKKKLMHQLKKYLKTEQQAQ